LRAVALLLLLTFSTSVLAEPLSYQLKVIPKGERENVSPTSRMCFTFSEYKQLLVIDDELFTARQVLKEQGTKVGLLQDSRANLTRQLDLSLQSIVVLQKENQRITTQWVETDKELQEERAKGTSWWVWALGIGGGAALLAAAGVVVGISISNK